MSQQELNLLQFTTSLVAQTGACTPEIVGRESRNFAVFCFPLHYTPNNLGAETGSPDPASLVDRAKEPAGDNSGTRHPSVNPSFHPIRDWNGPYVAALADKIGNDPVLLPLLDVLNSQGSQFGPA